MNSGKQRTNPASNRMEELNQRLRSNPASLQTTYNHNKSQSNHKLLVYFRSRALTAISYPQFAFHDPLLISEFNSFCCFLCLAKLGCLDHASILKLKCLDCQLQTEGIKSCKMQHFGCLGDTE